MEKTEYIEILIENITYICREKNISPHMLGKESGVGKDFLANINKGSLPSCDKLAKVADYCDVSVDDLLSREHASSGSINNYSHIHNIGENTTIGHNIGRSCDVSEDAVEMDKVLSSLGHKDRINVI
ncbi:MAG: hypothetical protein K2J32_12745 [Ruminococcus sp.]|nr:hypothetical protein [Ruminococcus sp.]